MILEAAASVTIVALGYRARAAPAAGYKNPGRPLLIYADAGGRPISHPVLCHAQARARLARRDSTFTTIAEAWQRAYFY